MASLCVDHVGREEMHKVLAADVHHIEHRDIAFCFVCRQKGSRVTQESVEV
jgi:hypothetical protein